MLSIVHTCGSKFQLIFGWINHKFFYTVQLRIGKVWNSIKTAVSNKSTLANDFDGMFLIFYIVLKTVYGIRNIFETSSGSTKCDISLVSLEIVRRQRGGGKKKLKGWKKVAMERKESSFENITFTPTELKMAEIYYS